MSRAEAPPFLSVIIPAYNEALRLPKTLEALDTYLEAQPYDYEIIIVDDGSRDGTAGWVQAWSKQHPHVVLMSYPQNRGKGYAVKQGVLNATGHYFLLYDADGATAIEELDRFLPVLQPNQPEVVIGSRALYSPETRIQAHWHRKVLGRIFTLFLFYLTPGIHDTQCGFKLFPRSMAMALFSLQTLSGYAFDVEILHAARQNHYPIREVPINWSNVKGSKVNILTDSAWMFLSLFKIAWQSLSGHYRLD